MTNSKHPLELLGHITAEQFLADYWQKKPLLVKQALPGYCCPISSDEMAGLAMEDTIESRIIIEHGENAPWQLQRGPFTEQHFQNLPESHWTLLIQQLDAWCPEINELKKHFQFIPNWRIDDVMASYAPVGGSVGPHFDYYDVFLLQAQGQRHWRLGQYCDETSERLENTPLSILKEFNETESWVLEPGDMLYLPPKLAHYGIAVNDCITLSIGFRAPTQDQILGHFTDHLLEHMESHRFYEDPDLKLQNHCGEISKDVIAKIQQTLTHQVCNENNIKRWFGQFITEPKNDQVIQQQEDIVTPENISSFISYDDKIVTNEGSRFAYALNDTDLLFFVDGKSFKLDQQNVKFVQTLCEMGTLQANQIINDETDTQLLGLLVDLLNNGSLYLE